MFRVGTIVIWGYQIPFPVWEEVQNGIPWGSIIIRITLVVMILSTIGFFLSYGIQFIFIKLIGG